MKEQLNKGADLKKQIEALVREWREQQGFLNDEGNRFQFIMGKIRLSKKCHYLAEMAGNCADDLESLLAPKNLKPKRRKRG